jgi:uncharacterized membrane protein
MPKFISTSTHTHHDAERWTSRVLKIGVWVSAGLMIAGLLIAAIFPSAIRSLPTNPSFGNLAGRIFSAPFDPVTLMFTGLVLLMFTPVLRVFTAAVAFVVERDWRFVFVSSIVLFLLASEIVYSIFIKG